MKKNARQWGFFAILLTAVLASGQGGATTVLFYQDPALENLDVGDFPFRLPDTVRGLSLPDESPIHFPATFLTDWPGDTSGEVVIGTLSTLPAGRKSERSGAAADLHSSRPGLSEREMAAWKSNGEPEDWLFRMQFTRAFDYEEPEPLIPIPEPTSGLLVLMGIASLAVWSKIAEH